MGIAILWVMFYHFEAPINGIPEIVKNYGYGGVDIFLFASGIGNYLSYLRDESPGDFLKRRINRLAPTYLPFIIFWLVYKFLNGNKAIVRFAVGNIFGVQGLTVNGNEFNWYITAILVCYVLTPYLASFVRKNSLLKNSLLVLFLLLLSVAFWEDKRLIIAASRLPVFVVGMIFAKHGDSLLSKKIIAGALAALAAGFALSLVFSKFFSHYLWTKGLFWYPFLLISPGLCIIISEINYFIDKHRKLDILLKPLRKLIAEIGKCSFEIFLVHIFVFEFADRVKSGLHLPNDFITYCCLSILSICAAAVLNRLAESCKKKIAVKKQTVDKIPSDT